MEFWGRLPILPERFSEFVPFQLAFGDETIVFVDCGEVTGGGTGVEVGVGFGLWVEGACSPSCVEDEGFPWSHDGRSFAWSFANGEFL